MKKIYLIAAVIALAAGVATYFFASELKKDRAEETTVAVEMQTVLIAKEDIPQNTMLKAEMFEEKQIPKDASVYGAVSSINEVVGFMSTEKILSGEQLMVRKIGMIGNEEAIGRLSYRLPNGMYAVAINVESRNAIAYALKEGDKINIYDPLMPNAPVLEKITVLAIGDYTANVQQDGGVEIMSYTTVTLEVTKEQISKVLTVENGCRIALVSHAESYGLGDGLNNVPAESVTTPEPPTNNVEGVTEAPPPTIQA